MSKATVLKNFFHLKRLVEDESFRNEFCYSLDKDEKRLNQVKSDLVKSDAQNAINVLKEKFKKAGLEKEYPEIFEVATEETKPKGKK